MAQLSKSIDRRRLQFYLWVGCAYLLLWLIVDGVSHPGEFLSWALNEVWRAVYVVPVNYLLFEYTLPQLRKKHFFRFLFLLVVQFFLFSIGLYIWRNIGIQSHIYTSFTQYTSVSHGVSDQLGAGIFSVFFFGIIRHVYGHVKLKQAAQQLQIEKQQAELNYLKSQTNPHFLFNTLNNIYALAKDKSDLAPESILRLSTILRFMLYETGVEYIAIEQELKIIGDYIALEQLRYDDSLRVNFNHDIEDLRQALPPLLLIPLVENAFKHGVSETRNHPFVDIHLSVRKGQLALVIKNSSESSPDERHVKEHIGLSNLRRQLELLYTDYNLSVQQEGSTFTANLGINLASHV